MIINALSPNLKKPMLQLSAYWGDFWQNLPHGPIGTPQFDPLLSLV